MTTRRSWRWRDGFCRRRGGDWRAHHCHRASNEFLGGLKLREAVTIYEIFDNADEAHARALYSYRWEPQTDPFGVVHTTYDYPGVPVAFATIKRRHAVLDGIKIPLRSQFGERPAG